MSSEDLPGFGASVPPKSDSSTHDTVKTLAGTSEYLETLLAQALADAECVRMLARRATERAELVAQLEAQVSRAKEREELLQTQLAAKEMEVDEIYNVSITQRE